MIPPKPQIDDIQRVQAEVSQVVMNCVYQVLAAGESVNPGFVRSRRDAHLGDDRQALRIGVQRMPDDLVRQVRTIEIAGIYVVDAGSTASCRP